MDKMTIPEQCPACGESEHFDVEVCSGLATVLCYACGCFAMYEVPEEAEPA